MEFDITKHELVPEHIKLSEEEKKKVLETYNISTKQIPSILKIDPAIQHLNLNVGDVVAIKRKSHNSKDAIYYRVVING